MNESDKVAMFASANLGLSGLIHWAEKLEPVFRSLAVLCQVGVAVLSMLYIWKRVKSAKRKRK